MHFWTLNDYQINEYKTQATMMAREKVLKLAVGDNSKDDDIMWVLESDSQSQSLILNLLKTF